MLHSLYIHISEEEQEEQIHIIKQYHVKSETCMSKAYIYGNDEEQQSVGHNYILASKSQEYTSLPFHRQHNDCREKTNNT